MYTYEKVWDVETGRMFWYNHHTKVSYWERPHLLWRYGDVSMPSPWIVDSKSTPEKPCYWHVTAKKFLPRKPDGIPLCSTCRLKLAIHYCNDCKLNYCFTCQRDTHAHPQGIIPLTNLLISILYCYLAQAFYNIKQLLKNRVLTPYSSNSSTSSRITTGL